MQSPKFLTEFQYCHVINHFTGKIRLVEGPTRLKLGLWEELYGQVHHKLILKENQYVVVLNPIDPKTKKYRHGDREIRKGPAIFSLNIGEDCEQYPNGKGGTVIILDAYLLQKEEGMIMEAQHSFHDQGIDRTAGDRYLITGPCQYIPHKYERLIKTVKMLSLGEYEGVYIKNMTLGTVRLEEGPKSVMMASDEQLYVKDYTNSEIEALQFPPNFDRTLARPLWVLENEAALIMSEEDRQVIKGPKVVTLGPYQRPYIMKISAGTPKGTAFLKIWKIKLGPSFSTNVLIVRTKDNAVLKITLRFKWRFQWDDQNPFKVFEVSDFIGLAMQTMASFIRDETANHNFEEFHSKASEILKRAILDGNLDHKGDYGTYIFKENGFEIFDIDINEIVPENPDIANQLNDAIKSNMNLFVEKLKQAAKLEAERDEIERRKGIERANAELIEIERMNAEHQKLGEARIVAQALLEQAEAEAKCLQIKQKAATDAEIDRIQRIIALMDIKNSAQYLKLKHIEALGSISKIIVPPDARIFATLSKDPLEDTDESMNPNDEVEKTKGEKAKKGLSAI